MTREEKQKAIDALKMSAPIMAMTQEEFNDYIRTLNKIMNWLKQEPCEDWCDVPSDEMTLEQARQAVRDLRKKLVEYLERELTTKNDSVVDAVNRADVHDMLENLPITTEDKWFNWLQKACMRLAELPPATPQEPKIKVLDRDEVARKLGAVDIYKASAWITLLKELEYLGLKICEVKE